VKEPEALSLFKAAGENAAAAMLRADALRLSDEAIRGSFR
jgi:hypothetical protein